MALPLSNPAPSEERTSRQTVIAYVEDAETEKQITDGLIKLEIDAKSVRRGGMKAATDFFHENPSPNVIIVDISSSSAPMEAIDALAMVCEPDVSVIVVGDNESIDLYRDLIDIGVTEYLVKPLPYTVLYAALKKGMSGNVSSTARGRRGELIAVTGARGGVGATTVVANLGYVLSEELSRRVALMDFDLHNGSLSLALNLKTNSGLKEALENAARIDALFLDRSMVPFSERLKILSGELAIGEVIKVEDHAVQELLRILERKFHYMIVDVPRNNDPHNMRFLREADVRIIVADPTVASIRDVLRRLAVMGDETDGNQIVIVLNQTRVYAKNDIKKSTFEESIGRRVDYEIPFGKELVASAINFGEPIAASKNVVSAALSEIGHDLVGVHKIAPKSFTQRLLRR